MAFENVKCFGCQQYGHLERDCPEKTYAAEIGDGDKPPWCNECDRNSRLVYFIRDGAIAARRCQVCHPSGHLLAVQFRRCKPCKAVVYIWDNQTECGSHPPVGKRTGELIAGWDAIRLAKAEREARDRATEKERKSA